MYAPMLAVSAPPDDTPREWVEIKWDGYRCIAHVKPGRTRLWSRRLRDFGPQFPELTALHEETPGGEAVLDGEIVAFEGDRPSFHHLQSRFRPKSNSATAADPPVPVTFIAFDLLVHRGEPLLRLPLRQRRDRLEAVVRPGERLQLSPVFQGIPEQLLTRAMALGLEGVVVKEPESPYLPGRRSSYWRKMKHWREMEAPLVGFTASGTSMRALLVAVPDEDGQLQYAGRVGTGFTEEERRRWYRRLHPLVRSHPALAMVPPDVPPDALWVEPVLKGRIGYLEMTPQGRLRHPTFLGRVN